MTDETKLTTRVWFWVDDFHGAIELRTFAIKPVVVGGVENQFGPYDLTVDLPTEVIHAARPKGTLKAKLEKI